MSDSEISVASTRLPPEREISRCLYRVVRDAITKGAEITTRQARSQAETELGLDPGFFKNDSTWNAKSKQILVEAIEAPESPKAPKVAAKVGRKRKLDEVQSSRRQRKKAAGSQSEEDLDGHDGVEASDDDFEVDESPAVKQKSAVKRKPAKTKSKAQPKKKFKASRPPDDSADDLEDDVKRSTTGSRKPPGAVSDSGEGSENVRDDSSDRGQNGASRMTGAQLKEDGAPASKIKTELEEQSRPHKTGGSNDDMEDESDYSIVVDEEPARKGRGKKAATTKSTNGKSNKSVIAKSDDKSLSPDDEEVKRLQGWLIKCGIRKLWHKELANCSNAKQKIKHLKALLTDAGMTGRYSVEKARAIKEARELADEIEAAQEFNKRWGEKSGDDGNEHEEEESEADSQAVGPSRAPPSNVKRLPKGLVDFGDDDDDDEEDD
nr:hira-interacting protein 3 [Quercus suber]